MHTQTYICFQNVVLHIIVTEMQDVAFVYPFNLLRSTGRFTDQRHKDKEGFIQLELLLKKSLSCKCKLNPI